MDATDAEVTAAIKKRFGAGADGRKTPARALDEAVRIALEAHHANQGGYTSVVMGRLGPSAARPSERQIDLATGRRLPPLENPSTYPSPTAQAVCEALSRSAATTPDQVHAVMDRVLGVRR